MLSGGAGGAGPTRPRPPARLPVAAVAELEQLLRLLRAAVKRLQSILGEVGPVDEEFAATASLSDHPCSPGRETYAWVWREGH
ncbi:MAG: hypothetical protein KatS3mg077_2224 [Candidatus Binatia bacterium]|nr:MAG: hypothetical protein KatS3mg077_2224 [Candidatus Binatia bacterium]